MQPSAINVTADDIARAMLMFRRQCVRVRSNSRGRIHPDVPAGQIPLLGSRASMGAQSAMVEGGRLAGIR